MLASAQFTNPPTGSFDEAKMRILPGFFSPELCRVVYDYVMLRRSIGRIMRPDERVPSAPRLYGDPLTETLLAQKQSIVEEAVGHPLWPSYSYLRLHGKGAELPAHTDREASELAVSVNIGGDAIWPLHFSNQGQELSVVLNVGDGIVYRGRELSHWRTPYDGDVQVQCILFYVCADGEFKDFRYDGRSGIGLPPIHAKNVVPQPLGGATAPTASEQRR